MFTYLICITLYTTHYTCNFMTDTSLYKAYIFNLCIFIYVLLLLYKLMTNSMSQRLFYLTGTMEL